MKRSSDPRKAIDKAMKNMRTAVNDKEHKIQALSEEIVKNVKAEAPKAAEKGGFKTEMCIQYAGHEADMKEISARVKEAFTASGHELTEIKSLNIYIKPEDNAAYYVVNDLIDGHVVLF